MALGHILSQSISRNENYATPLVRTPAPQPTATLSKNLNRLLSAAVVSPRFQNLLLTNPVAALAAGYNGETFQLTPAEYTAVTSLCVTTIREFAAQLLTAFQNTNSESLPFGPEPQPDFHFAEMGKATRDTATEPAATLPRKSDAENSLNRYPTSSRLARCNMAPGDGYRTTSLAAKRYGS